MTPLTCHEADELLDLYAADACDSPQSEALTAHLATCAACTAALERSREMLALLDWQGREASARQRLDARIRKEARGRTFRAPTLTPFLHRLGSLAALLLVAVGLALWMEGGSVVPRIAVPEETSVATLSLEVVEVAVVPGVKEGAPELLVQPRTQDSHAMKEAAPAIAIRQTEEELRDHVRTKKSPRPLSEGATVNLAIKLRNGLRRPVELLLDDPRTRLQLDVKGPEVRRTPLSDAAAQPNVAPGRLLLEPGETKQFTIQRLEDGPPGARNVLHLTAPSEYLLTVRLTVPAFLPETAREASAETTINLTAPAVRLRGPAE
jgi:hypothetical protein